MHQRPIEPGLLQIFRYFTGMAMVYFAVLAIYTAIQTGEGDTFPQIQSYINFSINLILLIYLYLGWLQRRLKRYYLPLALAATTVVLIFSNLIYLADPGEEAYITIMRSWLLFPMMIVPLVLIAWQFKFRFVVLFILFSTLVEYSVLLPKFVLYDFESLSILGVPLIRALAFGTVGQIVNRLIDTQRVQRKELMRANIQLSQHAKTLEQLAISRERNRLARELHDTLAHTLSGLAVNLEAMKFVPGGDSLAIRQKLDQALDNTRTGLAETRRALKDLRIKQLEELGLSIATRNLALDAASRAGFDLELDIDDELLDLTPDIEQCYYRIAQEGLENIVKHASAKNVTIHLSEEDCILRLIISDDGIGFEMSAIYFDDKHGLQGMRERAAEIGAVLEINSRAKEGSRIQLSMELIYGQDTDL